MTRFRLNSSASIGVIALAAMAASAPAYAQATDDATVIEEVVVTATKRSASLMTVPLSITAVSSEQIERLGAKDMEDIARSVPSLVVQTDSEQSDKTYVMRGIGSASQSATVAVYVDDTPLTFGNSMPDLKLFDVDRIEVLRGPQGTLFGSSAMGGAIRYITPKPSFSGYSGTVKAELSSIENGDPSYEFQGAIGGPVVEDKLAFRASAFSRHEGGYIDLIDEATGDLRKSDVNTVDSYGGRLALAAQVNDDIDVTLSAIYQVQEQNYLPTEFNGRVVGLVPTLIPLPQFSRVDRTDVYKNDKTFLPNLTANWDIGFATLTSSTSYMKRENEIAGDFSYYIQGALAGAGIPLPDTMWAQNYENREFEAWVQEVRLTSNGDGPLQWIVGAYYRTTDESAPQTLPNNVGDFLVFPGFELDLFTRQTTIERKQAALFGEASYQVDEKLKLTAGLRLTDMSMRVKRTDSGLFATGVPLDLKNSESPVTPKFSAQYTLSPDAMFYATAAKGFREGGSNTPPPALAACDAALAALGLTEVPSTFTTDTAWSYELGTKLQTSDRRLRFTGAAYRIDWSDMQQTVFLGSGCGYDFVGNLGKAVSQGAEAELSWRPIDPVRFDLNIGYTDAHFTEDVDLGWIQIQDGDELANVPEWTVSLAAQYDFQLLSDWDAFVRAEGQYIAGAERILGEPAGRREGYTLANLRAGVARGPYELNVFVNNLFDDDTILYQSNQTFAPGSLLNPPAGIGAYEAIRVRPRVVGVSLKRSF